MRPGGFEPPANGLEVRTGPLHRDAADPVFVQLCGVEAAPAYLYRHPAEPTPYTHSYTHPPIRTLVAAVDARDDWSA